MLVEPTIRDNVGRTNKYSASEDEDDERPTAARRPDPAALRRPGRRTVHRPDRPPGRHGHGPDAGWRDGRSGRRDRPGVAQPPAGVADPAPGAQPLDRD